MVKRGSKAGLDGRGSTGVGALRILALIVLTLLLLSGAPAVLALSNHLDLEAFEGIWLGRSLGRDEQPPGTAMTVRDVGVAIRATETGFEMTWKTPGQLGARSVRAQFVATSEAGRFTAAKAARSSDRNEELWAGIEGGHLLVFRSRSGQDGGAYLARYEISVSDGWMTLGYTLSEDGIVLESLEARLSRSKILQ